MTLRVKISHDDLNSDLGLSITDYNGTRELWAGQSADFNIYGEKTIEIKEIAKLEAAPVEVVAESESLAEVPVPETPVTEVTAPEEIPAPDAVAEAPAAE